MELVLNINVLTVYVCMYLYMYVYMLERRIFVVCLGNVVFVLFSQELLLMIDLEIN
jgi:hypothetical protein